MARSGRRGKRTRGAGPRPARLLDAVKVDRWRALVLEWESSGLSQSEFCRRRKVSVHTFRSWRYSLRRQERATGQLQGGFVELEVVDTDQARSGGIEIDVGAGRVVRVKPGFHPDTLREVLAVLAAPAC